MATKKKLQYFKMFNSIAEMLQYQEGKETTPLFKEEASQKKSKERDSFTGTRSFKEADDLLRWGDKELSAKVESKGVKDVRVVLKEQKPKRSVYSCVVGAMPNVPSYICGSPNSMIAVRKEQVKHKVLNVVYNLVASCGVSTDDIVVASARLIAALMMIESKGVRVNVWQAFGVSKEYDKDCDAAAWACKIKDARQPFDVMKMCYPMAHPSMIRRHMFRMMEITPELTDGFQHGWYGYPIKKRSIMESLMGVHARKVDALISFYDIRNKSVDEIIELINKN